MNFEHLLILTTVLGGLFMGISYFRFLSLRNIYTQKITFLNDQLSKIATDKITEYSISDFREFTIDGSGDRNYPPAIIDRYLINPPYKSSIKKITKLVIVSYLVLLIIFSIVFLMLG